jgi:tetratricopeptide (TPR) repeat protein
MELGRIDSLPKYIKYMKSVTNSLLCKVVNVPDERGGYTGFQLFKEIVVSSDEQGEWYVEIDAHDKALPLMFEFKNQFFTYKLWNALRLKSVNQLRMYEILKQYEKKGERNLSVEELKELLGIEKDKYPEYKVFKRDVLDVCQKALAEQTDITFTFEISKRVGKGGKIHSLLFAIKKNDDYRDITGIENYMDLDSVLAIEGECAENIEPFPEPLSLNDIDPDEAMELAAEGKISRREEMIIRLRDVMNNAFTFEQAQELYDRVITANLPLRDNDLLLHFQAKYNIAVRLESEGGIKKSALAYVRSIIDKP